MGLGVSEGDGCVCDALSPLRDLDCVPLSLERDRVVDSDKLCRDTV